MKTYTWLNHSLKSHSSKSAWKQRQYEINIYYNIYFRRSSLSISSQCRTSHRLQKQLSCFKRSSAASLTFSMYAHSATVRGWELGVYHSHIWCKCDLLVISITPSASYCKYFHRMPVRSGNSSSSSSDNFRILSRLYVFSTFAFLGAFGVTSTFADVYGEENSNAVFGVVGGLVMLSLKCWLWIMITLTFFLFLSIHKQPIRMNIQWMKRMKVYKQSDIRIISLCLWDA